jgi:L-seryl-tRNA(Ser) seleniumtransferase
MKDQKLLSALPKVDQVLDHPLLKGMLKEMPKVLLLKAVRGHLDDLRNAVLSEAPPARQEFLLEVVAEASAQKARDLAQPSLREVVNATGVVVHTNLGRSLLADRALKRLLALNLSYSNLEYDLKKGKRGSRYSHVEGILKELTGADAALVVNNNAAAVYLSLQTLANGKEVILSRGQMVEIGGSFRIPDVMARSGAILKSVGATNKTHLHDYENAITQETGLLLKVHTSNFAVVGFHKEVPLNELKELGLRHDLPVMEDLGSGCLVDFATLGLPTEPTVLDSLKQGADIITFSGDKLLGGPQAGIILGDKNLVEKLKKNPVNRAFRIDKLTLAALEATLELYRDQNKALAEIPTLRMISTTYKELTSRAAGLARRINNLGLDGVEARTEKGISRVGGGALPLAEPQTRLVRVKVKGFSATKLEAHFRGYGRPVICRLEDGRVLLDVRTLKKGDANIIVEAIKQAARQAAL